MSGPSEHIDRIVRAQQEGREFDARLFDRHGIDRTKTNATSRMMELARRGYVENTGKQGGRIIWRRTAKRDDSDYPIPREMTGWERVWPDLFRPPDLVGAARHHECI